MADTADKDVILDQFEDDLEDFETLPCSWNYVAVCILMPLLNGQLHALLFPGYTLHFEEMGWPLVRAGLAVTIGFLLSVLVQQVVVRNGYWLIVPLTIVHLVFAIFALIYTTSEWAIFAQIVCVFGIDPTCAVEGIAFDSFGASEVQAKQASSTALSVYTIAVALSCTIGGIVYDTLGWKGVCGYHAACQALLVLALCIHPACRRSFVEVFFGTAEDPAHQEDPKEKVEKAEKGLTAVMPAIDVCVEEIEEGDAQETRGSKVLEIAIGKDAARPIARDRRGRKSRMSRATHATGGTRGTGRTRRSRSTLDSGRSIGSVLSAFSRITALSQAGQDFQHHFGTSNVLQPRIARSTGAKAVVRDELPEGQGESTQNETPTGGLGIPKDVRFPAFLIVLNAAYNNAAYVIEYATFAIFFKQVHQWDEATLASVAQTAGDVLAAIAVQVLPALIGGSEDTDLEDVQGCWVRVRSFWHRLMSKPYNISFSLLTWVIFNLGMMSPSLPMALVAQIFMGTTFVYSSKWTTEMNLFYSLGDSKVFLSLQVMCRNAEAIGGGLGGLLATWLYTLDPLAPFTFTTAMALVAFVVYTVGFCLRLGCGDDIETAEAERAQQHGIQRIGMWKSQAGRSKAWET